MSIKGNFGMRLAQLRKEKGFTQRDFADNVGISQRMIAYYEKHVKRPPLEKLEGIARALNITIDELLDVKTIKKQRGAPKNAYLQRKLQLVTEFPKADQKIVTNIIDALYEKNSAHKSKGK
jgi:transcriptional regulator with XRE-family HTH domain